MLQMKSTQKASFAVKAFDSSEPPQEAPLEGITFTSSDETVCTVVQDPTDPKKAEVIGVGDGVAQILVNADADLGEGEIPLEGTLVVEIQSVIATNLSFEVSEPVDQ